MKERIKCLLEKYPTLYTPISKGYAGFHHLKRSLLGTRVMEKTWATMHLHGGTDWGHRRSGEEWVRGFWDSRDHNHRAFLIEKISNFCPNSILEVGCNCGPNLYLLAKKFPDAEIIGIDINPLAVQKGNEWLTHEGISNVKLLEGKADELGRFQGRSFDVVFTDGVLIYVGPDKIKEVMKEIIRLTRKALILMEWHSFEPDHKDPYGLGVRYDGDWKRNYVALLKQFVREEQIHVTKTPEEYWPEQKNWEEVGAAIEVVM
jgi:ubiquinone/menaquinone biosynthesis C-methylase UbiE